MATLEHEDGDQNTKRLVSEVSWADFGLTQDATEHERVEAAIEHAVRMVEGGEPTWAAASWCADALDVERAHATTIHNAVETEVEE